MTDLKAGRIIFRKEYSCVLYMEFSILKKVACIINCKEQSGLIYLNTTLVYFYMIFYILLLIYHSIFLAQKCLILYNSLL